MTKQPRWFTVRPVVISLVLAMALAACSDDSSPSADEVADEGDGALSQASIVYGNAPIATQWPVYVAIDQGFFAEEGLEVEFVVVPTGTEQVSSLIGGSLDMAGPGGDTIWRAIETGAELKVVAAQIEGVQGEVVMSREWAEQNGISETSTDVEFMEALRGARFGSNLPGGGIHAWTVTALRAYGLDPESDVSLEFIEGGSGLLAAFEADRLDAFVHSVPNTTLAAEREDAALFSLRDLTKVPDFAQAPQSFYLTTQSFIDDHPDTVQAFVNGIQKAQEFILANREEAAEILRQQVEGFPDGGVDLTYQMLADSDLAVSQEMFDAATTLVEAAADEPSDVTFEDVVDGSFVR